MPRQARTISPTSIYHVILRGVNKQQVFEDEEDYYVSSTSFVGKRSLMLTHRVRPFSPDVMSMPIA